MSSSIVPLLIWRNTLLVLDLSLDILNGVRRLNLKSDGLTRKGFYEDLHPQLTNFSSCRSVVKTIYSIAYLEF